MLYQILHSSRCQRVEVLQKRKIKVLEYNLVIVKPLLYTLWHTLLEETLVPSVLKSAVKRTFTTLYEGEPCSVLCGSLEGRGVWGRMDTCRCTETETSLKTCSSPETITTALISYTPIQNKRCFKNCIGRTLESQERRILALKFGYIVR